MIKNSITIALPTFNEEGSLEWLVKKTLKDLPKYFNNYEIVIVNDGSTDNTGKIADKLARRKTVRVIHQENQGFSGSMLTGIKAARKNYIAYMPADGQILISDMVSAFKVMEENDLVLGYRTFRQDYTIYRLILSFGYLIYLWALFGVKYKDVGWVNIWKAKSVQALDLKPSRGIFLLTEIVVRFNQMGLKIAQVQSKYRPRRAGKAKNAKLSIVINTFLQALKLKWQLA